MKKLFILLSFVILFWGCSMGGKDKLLPGQLEQVAGSGKKVVQLNQDPISSPGSSSEPKEVTEEEKAVGLAHLRIEYYINSSSKAEPEDAEVYRLEVVKNIASLCYDNYMESDPYLDENSVPDGFSQIKIYELSGRDDLIVITGDYFFQWPYCYLFLYQDEKLILFPDPEPFDEVPGIAEEIRLAYEEGFPYPMIEVFCYSHQGNGSFGVYELDGERMKLLAGEPVTGYHYAAWEEERKAPVFDHIGLKPGESFACRYEGDVLKPYCGHLTPYYEDEDGDGMIDIIMKGNFQCENSEGDILLSQEIKRVYLYDIAENNYFYNPNRSISSPLEETWDSDRTLWLKENKIKIGDM